MRLLADILYLLVYYLVRYRRKVTRGNLQQCFPQMSEAEQRKLERAYYRHMADLLVEAVHGLFASPASIKKHYRFVNRELVDRYYEQGRSVVLMSAHYNNWEYMVVGLGMLVRHHGIGVGKPLHDKGVADFVGRRRTRYGTQVVSAVDVRQEVAYYEQHGVPCAYMMLSDQSPSNYRKAYWTTFLGRDTAFLYGAEYFARKYDLPVLYYHVKKVRRGYYEVSFSMLCEKPSAVPQYTISERYARTLERHITEQPEFWLWSHKRWKHPKPADL